MVTGNSIYPTREQAKAARHMAEMIAMAMAMRGNEALARHIREFGDGMTGLTAADVDLTNSQEGERDGAPTT